MHTSISCSLNITYVILAVTHVIALETQLRVMLLTTNIMHRIYNRTGVYIGLYASSYCSNRAGVYITGLGSIYASPYCNNA